MYLSSRLFYDFFSARLPALFSQINQRGGQELHEVVGQIESFKKQVAILKKVHADSKDVVNLSNALKRILTQAASTLSIFSVLPGAGFQLRAVLSMDAVKFCIGHDPQEMALQILKGSGESAKYAFNANSKTLASWKSKFHGDSRKRDHGGQNRDNRGGNAGGKNGGKWVDKKKKFDKKPEKREFSGEN